jgi:hypothetical protein
VIVDESNLYNVDESNIQHIASFGEEFNGKEVTSLMNAPNEEELS